MRLILIAVFATILAVGCTMPVQNLPNQAVPVAVSNINFVRDAILAAGHSEGWQMSVLRQGPQAGLIQASKSKENKTAVVNVAYTRNSYSIIQSSTSGMRYNAASNSVNPKYNRWVNHLNSAIQAKLIKVANFKVKAAHYRAGY